MYSKADFDLAIENEIENYPGVAALFKAGDPRIKASLGANAQMLAMMSQNVEIAGIETFLKVRDATILADAALRGLVPKGIPTRVRLLLRNPSTASYTLAAGRTMIDSGGNLYSVDTPVTVPAGSTGLAELIQQTRRTISHTVGASVPFYEIPIPAATDGSYIAGIALADSADNAFTYSPGFTNINNGDRVFHVECDELQRLYVRFGYGGVIGYQPTAGETFVLTITDTAGALQLATGSPFSLDYTASPQDSMVKFELESLLIAGEAPMDISTLRELSKYPSLYDDNAVFLGEFDYIIRKKIPSLLFLSVWNEYVEEGVRGANQNNINKLFVSFQPPVGGDRTAYQNEITSIIQAADDSYRIGFVLPSVVPIASTVNAEIARVHDAEAVAEQIRNALLAVYGRTAPAAKSGMLVVQYKAVYQLLRAGITALQDGGSDFNVLIAALADQKPEDYRYMSVETLTVNVTLSDYNNGSWGR